MGAIVAIYLFDAALYAHGLTATGEGVVEGLGGLAAFGRPGFTGEIVFEASLGTPQRKTHTAGVTNAAKFTNSTRAAIGHRKKRALVAKGVLPLVFWVNSVFVFVAKPWHDTLSI